MPRAKTNRAPATKSKTPKRVTVGNPNVPGYTHAVDAEMYHAMRTALLQALPKKEPGLTQSEMRRAVLPYLSQKLYPGGAKADWWSKAVQLDLESKGIVVREKSAPLRWHRQ